MAVAGGGGEHGGKGPVNGGDLKTAIWIGVAAIVAFIVLIGIAISGGDGA